jgi:hypothetical protein
MKLYRFNLKSLKHLNCRKLVEMNDWEFNMADIDCKAEDFDNSNQSK